MSTELVYYNAARTALQHAASVDEVKSVKDKAEAMRLYAQQQRDTALEQYAAEIKARAMRRLGELSSELDKSKGGANPQATLASNGKSKSQSLKAAGLSTSQAHRCEQISRIPEKEFEDVIREKAQSGNAVTVADMVRKVVVKSNREERINSIIDKCEGTPLLPDKKYAVLYADPPWKYEHVKTENRAIENQYPTMELTELLTLPIDSITNKDAIIFLWANAPKLAEAMRVLESWGFTYRTCAVWVKDRIGMGYYFRSQHELLLVGIKGNMPVPPESSRVSSVIGMPREAHSAKPECVYEIIEQMYPSLPRIELFSRTKRDGWGAWGNQA